MRESVRKRIEDRGSQSGRTSSEPFTGTSLLRTSAPGVSTMTHLHRSFIVSRGNASFECEARGVPWQAGGVLQHEDLCHSHCCGHERDVGRGRRLPGPKTKPRHCGECVMPCHLTWSRWLTFRYKKLYFSLLICSEKIKQGLWDHFVVSLSVSREGLSYILLVFSHLCPTILKNEH